MYRKDFPFFNQNECVYLDSAATSQKPQRVIDSIVRFYNAENSNIHRGNYDLSRKASSAYENARRMVAQLIGADPDEIIFTKGATESLNLVAKGFLNDLDEKSRVIVSDLEHSSNYFPFREKCKRRGAEFYSAPVSKEGTLKDEDLIGHINEHTRLVSVTGMSNVNGYLPNLEKIISCAHEKGAAVLVDGSQMIAHHRINVKELDCDFLAFSGHKLYGPMGTGVLYIKKPIQNECQPLLYGGGTIVSDASSGYPLKETVERYEAGTPDVAGVIGLGAAIEYLNERGLDQIFDYERTLASYLHGRLKENDRIEVIGEVPDSTVVSFKIKGMSSYDAGVILSLKNIAVRCGGHCAYPMMNSLGEENLIRVSLAMYNNREDVDRLIEELNSIARKAKN